MINQSKAAVARAIRKASLLGIVAFAAAGAACAQEEQVEQEQQEQQGVAIDPNVYNMYLESRIQRPADQATPEEARAVRDELTDIWLLSEQPRAQELKDSPRLKAQLELQSRAIVAQAVATDYIASNPATDEEKRALYAEQAENAPPEYKARHILVETQGEAIALIGELEGGGDFSELAKANSTGPSAATGGDLGWFPPDRMVAEFSAAVEALADGAFTTTPVQTQFGWHVILREGSRESTPPPYESVADVLKQQVEQRKLQDYLQSLRTATQ